MKFLNFFLSVPILFVLVLSPLPARGFARQEVVPPQRNQIAAENKFNQAYRLIMKKHYWSGIELIDESLKSNPYYVDGYLLKSLALYRTGHLEEAIKNLTYYLEVRTRDYIAHKIYQGMKKISKDELAILPVIYSGKEQILKDYLELPPGKYMGTTGIGNGAWIGGNLCIPDMLGDRILILSRKNISSIDVEKPVAITPVDDYTFVVATHGGHILEYSFDEFNDLKKVRDSRIDETIGEIAFITSDRCILSHPQSGTVTVRTYPQLETIKKWSPEGDDFVEIKGISVVGNILAICIRNKDKIILTDVDFKKVSSFVNIDSPRSVLLSSREDMLVLSDNGTSTLFRLEKKNWVKKETIKTPEGFSLCTGDNKVSVITADGRLIYSLTLIPSQKDMIMTGMSLCNPEIGKSESGNVLYLNARVSSKFGDYLAKQRPVFTSVWQNMMRPGRVRLVSNIMGDVFLIASKKNKYLIDTDKSVVILGENESLEKAIKNIWEVNSGISSIILDSSIKTRKDEIVWLLRFCKFNGIVLNCWSTAVPSEYLLNAALNSGGKCYFTLNVSNKNFKKQKTNNMIIKIYYPETTYSSGYPSKNMLSTIVDFGIISYRDWLPMWPDLLRAKKEI